MRESPLVSICIPVYNMAAVVHEAVESALRQTYENTEIVIVDNHSEDGSWEALQKYSSHGKVRLARNDANIGFQRNCNRCAQLSKGEYLKFLFADDLLYSRCVETMMDAALRHPDAGLIFSRRDFLLDSSGEGGVVLARLDWLFGLARTQRSLGGGVHDGRRLINTIFPVCDNFVGEASSTLMRKSVFTALGGFDADFNAMPDLELWINVLKTHNGLFVDRSLSAFRIHENQAYLKDRSILKYRNRERLLLYGKHRDYLEGNLERGVLEDFAWKTLLLTALSTGDRDFYKSGECREILGRLFRVQGGGTGLVSNVLRYLFRRLKVR